MHHRFPENKIVGSEHVIAMVLGHVSLAIASTFCGCNVKKRSRSSAISVLEHELEFTKVTPTVH